MAKRARVEEEQDGTREDPYAVPAEEVMRITYVYDPSEVLALQASHDRWFRPAFTHQVFGQDEVVRGYESCLVSVYLHATTMHAFVSIETKGKQENADDIPRLLDENLGLQYTSDAKEFEERVRATEPKLREEIARAGGYEGGVVSYQPHREDCTALRELHDRLQFLPLLYVDGANYIDNTDPRWSVYLGVSSNGTICGFATVYTFYAYPARERLRLSQILVLPPHRGRGVASSLLRRAYDDAARRGAIDLTVEDPSEEFQALRERVDLRRVLGDAFFENFARDAVARHELQLRNGMRPDALLMPTRDVYAQAEDRLKIHRAQLRKVWECVLLRELSRGKLADVARDLVAKVVEQRLSTRLSEQRLQRASSNKHVIDRSKDDFIMTRVFLGAGGKREMAEPTEEEARRIREEDEGRVDGRMAKVVALAGALEVVAS